ncbi:MAG: aminotransferase class I/II-fold pyridoxal phosphate-dependent enzyme [Candidatus Micrarchaeia archaeon]
MEPELSEHFKTRKPSGIRLAQIEFAKREDGCMDLNVAIGNVSLPMHPKMIERMKKLAGKDSPFEAGIVKYTPTVGTKEANDAALNIIASSGFSTDGLYSQILDGGSQAMELVIVGTCGPAGSEEKPLLLIDPAYTNYNAFAKRVGRKTVSVGRKLEEDGSFSLPNNEEMERVIKKHKPAALVVIPYDNPTGQLFSQEQMIALAKICVKHNMWIISDEAYRELNYAGKDTLSIWGLTNKQVPGIEGRRISIETTSKVWNACGLRIGAIVTDNKEFHEKSVAEYTANLCANAIGQYIFGALAHESHADLKKWYGAQRTHYKKTIIEISEELKHLLPGIIVSRPDASIYSVIDVRNIAKKGFDATKFVMWCAQKGKVKIDGKDMTLLVSPMEGFYECANNATNPGKTQMRIAYVLENEKMRVVPQLFCKLFKQYCGQDSSTCMCDEVCQIKVKKKVEEAYSEG